MARGRSHGDPLLEEPQRRHCGVLELDGDRIAALCQCEQRRFVLVPGDKMCVSNPARGSLRVGIQDDGLVSHRPGGNDEIQTELPATEDAERAHRQPGGRMDETASSWRLFR